MYSTLLTFHSLLRWLVILAGLLAVARGLSGWRTRRPWEPTDGRAGLWFAVSLDVQFLVGLVLYAGLSPLTRIAFSDPGAAMANSVLRFWAVEHAFGMTAALVLAHIGRARVRKAEAADKHRISGLFLGLALLAVLATIPWPGMPYGRPLFGWF